MKNLIKPCLWLDETAREAAEFYCLNFRDSIILHDSPLMTTFMVAGQEYVCLNGGPRFKPNPSISFFYICESGEEIETLWDEFSIAGTVVMPLDQYDWSEKYGFVTDRFGVSWQFSLGRLEDVGQIVTPCLTYAGEQCGRAEEALEHYISIFPDSTVDGILRYGENEPGARPGTVKHSQIGLCGEKMMLMDAADAPDLSFTEGVSLMVICDSQAEIDRYWERLAEGGEEGMCGWLKDKFGVWWQVVPAVLGDLMRDPARSSRVIDAFKKMKKFEIQALLAA